MLACWWRCPQVCGVQLTPRIPIFRSADADLCRGLQAAEVDARMLGALLTGVRRAFPFVESSKAEDVATQHADALFRILHTAPFGVAVQALALLFQLLSARSAVSDRFYRYSLQTRFNTTRR